jgi:hypothetical protein
MNLDFVEDNEILHRALKPNLTFWSTKDNRPTSALFKDSKGVSADRTGFRSESEIRNSMLTKFPGLSGEIQVLTLDCRKLSCKVEPAPHVDNPFHALIKGDENIQLSNNQARQLAKLCKFIKYDRNPQL